MLQEELWLNSQTLPKQCLDMPVKKTLLVTKEILSSNKALFYTLMAVSILISFSSLFPAVGVVATITMSILLLSAQLYIGKLFFTFEHMDSFVDTIAQTNIKTILTSHLHIAAGVYLGWILVVSLPIILFGFAMGYNALAPFGAITLILFVLALLYIHPLVTARTIMAESFGEGFRAVFSFLKTDIWRLGFRSGYFRYISLMGLVLTAIIIVLALLIALMTFLVAGSGLEIGIGAVLNGILGVVYMVFSAIFAIVSYAVAQNG